MRTSCPSASSPAITRTRTDIRSSGRRAACSRGKRRIHDKPNRGEVAACRPWLDAELAAVEPRVLVLLGATAAQALLGSAFRVTRERGRAIDDTGFAEHVGATVHPSAIVRMRDREERAEAERGLADDLRTAARLVAS